MFYISTFIYTSGPGISVYCDSANNTSYDLKSVAYTNNGSNGPYLSIVALKISVSFCYNEKKNNLYWLQKAMPDITAWLYSE